MSFLRTIGPASMEVWISSPVRSRKPVLMKATRSRASSMQALRLSVVRRSSSMIPTLMVSRRQAEQLLDAAEQLDGEGDLVGAVHLRLHDVHRAGARVRQLRARRAGRRRLPSAVMIASRMPSGTSLPSRSSTASVVIRWPTWRMNSSERPRSVTSSPDGRGVGAVGVHRPGEGLAALGDLLGERALHQPQPVAVAEHLVLGVDGRDRVLEVHDRGDRGLQQQVLDAGGVGGADRVLAVDLDLDVQAVVDQQHRLGRLRRPR